MKLNISIDDVSPHPRSSIKVLDRCFELIKSFPDIKFSLFVPIAYWRTVRPEIATQYPLLVNQFPDFCKFLKDLPKENFEICYHGFYHGIPGKNDNDEFQLLSKEEAIQKFQMMFSVVNESNLTDVFKPIFRPPAWRMSPGSIEAAKEVGIEILALSPKEYALQTYKNSYLNSKVVFYTCNPPFDDLQYFEKNEIVYHACEWDKNYLSIDLTQKLSEWLNTQNELNFCFLEDLVVLSKNKIKE